MTRRTERVRVARLASAVIIFFFGLPAGATALGQEAAGLRSEGRRLEDALVDLQQRGLRIIYSSEVVRADMRVRAEPRATSLRRILDELLAEHGLIAQNGPGGIVVVVRNRRARPESGSTPQKPPSRPPIATAGAAGDAAGKLRVEETVEVTSPAIGAGPPPFTVRPVDAQTLAGGFENIFRTLHALPGVMATDELGSRTAVRGGSPDQNLVVMDGIEIYNPFRLVVPTEDLSSVGLITAFNSNTIEHFEFHSGAFDLRYGDRLSSLLVVRNREGSDAKAFQGSLSLGLADGSVLIEGKLPRRASGSWLISVRRTYLDLVAERVVGFKLPSFYDVQARVSWRPAQRQRVSLVGIAGRERTRPGSNANADSGYSTKSESNLVALTMESSVGSQGFSRTIAAFSQLADRLEAFEHSLDNSRGSNTPESILNGGLVQFQLSRDIGVRDFSVRQEFAFTPSSRHGLDVGAEAHQLATRWAWSISGDRNQQQANGSSVRLGASLPDFLDSSRDSNRMSAWVQDRWQISPRLMLQPGLRVDRSSVTGRSTLSPRLSGTVIFGSRWRLDAALRAHSQSPGYEKMLQSDYFVDLSSASASGLKPERAFHAVAGLQREFTRGFRARVDVYYTRFNDLIVGRLETDDERLARLAGYDVPAPLWSSVPDRAQITISPENGAAGHAHGVEVLVAYAGRLAAAPLTGWVAYSFGRANRAAYGVTRPFDYDRRHALSLAASLRIGPRFDVSFTARLATGLPRTPILGVRLALVPDVADVDGDGNRDERVPQRDALGAPVFQPDLGDINNLNRARSPGFARVDARATYRPSWSGERWAFYLDLVNVFNTKNVTQIDSALVFDPGSNRPRIVEIAGDRGIPFFPSFGIRFWF